MWKYTPASELFHYGVKGMKWGRRTGRQRIYGVAGKRIGKVNQLADWRDQPAHEIEGRQSDYIQGRNNKPTRKGIIVRKDGRAIYVPTTVDKDGTKNYIKMTPFANNQTQSLDTREDIDGIEEINKNAMLKAARTHQDPIFGERQHKKDQKRYKKEKAKLQYPKKSKYEKTVDRALKKIGTRSAVSGR